jgi:hypothetical protein
MSTALVQMLIFVLLLTLLAVKNPKYLVMSCGLALAIITTTILVQL